MDSRASRVRYFAAFAAIYIIWGSTYLAIRYAVETVPPLLMASARFILGGTLFFLWANFRSSPTVTASQLRWTTITGVLMLGAGGGAVHWAERYVPSGLTALLVASVPLMMVLLDWLRPSGRRPSGLALTAVIAGFIGIGFLVQPETDITHQAEYLAGSIAVLVGCLAWSFGSVLSRYVDLPESKSLETSLKLLAGGLALLIAGLLSGEAEQIVWAQISRRSVLALVYLVVLGSSAFVGYNYLLKVTTTAKVATYAYINPVVAV
ncbi:MAG: EamA family transporter, partial [Candidatus Zixiibacteriota bacterium]